jgi:hypothetical protein
MPPYCIQSETRGALFDLIYKLADTQQKKDLICSFFLNLIEAGSSPS